MFPLILTLCLFDKLPPQAPMPPQAPTEEVRHEDHVKPLPLRPFGDGWQYEQKGGYWWRYTLPPEPTRREWLPTRPFFQTSARGGVVCSSGG